MAEICGVMCPKVEQCGSDPTIAQICGSRPPGV
uniref:Uncharacterized protein n=1 Tax=Physcomitrium patens TaxID=3218 RepID=A0A7I4FKT1_PHYPA